MENEIKRLKIELEKSRFQLYVFYELTKAMRTTLRLEEIIYIILTGLTARQGLGFNRAVIFFIDEEAKKINGFMGMGSMDSKEADEIWQHIEDEEKDLYDLIVNYNRLKEDGTKPKFMKLIQSLSFPLNKKSGILFENLYQKGTKYIKIKKITKLIGDPIVKKLELEEFLICSLWINEKPTGIIIVDNNITKKLIEDEDIKFFNMFIEQASGAIKNSQNFERTLTKMHTDSLTSLWNYGYFQYKLDEEIKKAQSLDSHLSVLMIDLDDFKKFNDANGHLQGDDALQRISLALRENCRKIDILCRYGGEEFALILPANNKKEAGRLAERIRKSIEQKNILNNKFTVSIGLSTYPQDAQDKINLVRKADEALYEAKRKGKNKVILA